MNGEDVVAVGRLIIITTRNLKLICLKYLIPSVDFKQNTA